MPRILIIDDDPTIQKLFSCFLEKKGYEVSQAENGKIGMTLMQENRPDLIITDILMPEMDGLEILIKIRQAYNDIPVIAVSGGMRDLPINFLKQAKMFGARYTFEKPVPLDVLYNAILNLLEKHQTDLSG